METFNRLLAINLHGVTPLLQFVMLSLDTLLVYRLMPWKKTPDRRLMETETFYLFDVGVEAARWDGAYSTPRMQVVLWPKRIAPQSRTKKFCKPTSKGNQQKSKRPNPNSKLSLYEFISEINRRSAL